MSLSKVDMAALVQGGTRLAICGDLTAEEGRMLQSAEIFFVVHQGDSVVRGRGTYREHEGHREWGACADLIQLPQPLSLGKAVAMGLVVAESSTPVGSPDAFGFTTFTWMQDIMIRDGLPPEEPDRIDPCA
jgi:hypothetical protein